MKHLPNPHNKFCGTLKSQKLFVGNTRAVFNKSDIGKSTLFDNLAGHLEGTCGTLLWPGTVVENHCFIE
jgi:hypothetical protein